MNDVVKMGKCGCIASGIWLVQGDTRSHVLTIHVPRMESGVDLKDLGWIIKITNEAGVDDVDVPVTGSVVIGERTIAFDWLIHGVATDVPGKTIFSIEGVDETEDGKPIIWRSSPATIYVREKHDATPSEEVETELGELQKMIVYVNGELANVIAAGEMARSAATHPPIIGENGNWFLWDFEKEIYVDSGKNAQGPKGIDSCKNLVDSVGTYKTGLRGIGAAEEKDGYRLGDYAAAVGLNTRAHGNRAFAEGASTVANGVDSHAEGTSSETASDARAAHAEGINTRANGEASHSEGMSTVANGDKSHAEGTLTEANGENSHAQGLGTVATGKNQHVAGTLNVLDTENKYAEIIGNGSDDKGRSNARTLDWKGNAWYGGDVYVGGAGQDDNRAEKLVKQSELTDAIKNKDVFVVHVSVDENYNYIADKTADEVRAAVDAGKLPIMFENMGDIKNTYLYCGEKSLNSERWPYFRTFPLNGANGHKTILEVYLTNDKTVEGYAEFPMTAVTEHKLIIKHGDEGTKFDGSEETIVDLSNLSSGGGGQFYFTVTENGSGIKCSKTFAEIKAAYDAGLEPVCVYDWETVKDSQRYRLFRKILTLEIEQIYKNADFHAFIKENPAFPYNYIQIDIKENDDGSNLITINKSRYASFNDIPTKLPNPASLTIKQGSNSWTYSGAEAQTVNLPSIPTSLKNPNSLNIKVNGVSNYYDGSTSKTVDLKIPEAVTSLPWDKITDKPFGESTVFNQQITFTEKQILIPTPFALQEGMSYTITAGDPAFGGMSFTDTAVAGNTDGPFDYVGIGNPAIFGMGADNGMPFALLTIPGGLDEGGVKIYGAIAVTDQLFAMVQNATLPVKVELTGGATPIPEELIPTMSETTKGGAKVGKGLKMDGDTLNVDEGVWELIDSITCDGTYGNIARTGFALKQVEIDIHMMAAEQASSVGVEIKNEKELFGYAWIANLLNTAERYAFIRAHIENKNAYIEVTSAGTSSYGSSPLSRSTSRHTDGGAIVRIGMYVSGGANFPEGSTIEIWGVRA